MWQHHIYVQGHEHKTHYRQLLSYPGGKKELQDHPEVIKNQLLVSSFLLYFNFVIVSLPWNLELRGKRALLLLGEMLKTQNTASPYIKVSAILAVY